MAAQILLKMGFSYLKLYKDERFPLDLKLFENQNFGELFTK